MTAPDAAIAVGGDRPAARQLRLLRWTPLAKGALFGFATVELPIRLRIINIPILAGTNGPWSALPGKPEFDRDGRPKADIHGKPTNAPILGWRPRELGDKFSEAAIAAVRHTHPDDLV